MMMNDEYNDGIDFRNNAYNQDAARCQGDASLVGTVPGCCPGCGGGYTASGYTAGVCVNGCGRGETYISPSRDTTDWYGYGSSSPIRSSGYARGDISQCVNTDGSTCGLAKQRLCQAGGDVTWVTTHTCADVSAKICSDSTLFVSSSGEDTTIRSWAGCPVGSGGNPIPGCPCGTSGCPACTTIPAPTAIDPLILVGGAALVGLAILFATAGPSSKTITIARQ